MTMSEGVSVGRVAHGAGTQARLRVGLGEDRIEPDDSLRVRRTDATSSEEEDDIGRKVRPDPSSLQPAKFVFLFFSKAASVKSAIASRAARQEGGLEEEGTAGPGFWIFHISFLLCGRRIHFFQAPAL